MFAVKTRSGDQIDQNSSCQRSMTEPFDHFLVSRKNSDSRLLATLTQASAPTQPIIQYSILTERPMRRSSTIHIAVTTRPAKCLSTDLSSCSRRRLDRSENIELLPWWHFNFKFEPRGYKENQRIKHRRCAGSCRW